MRQKKILVSMKALLLVVALWFACAAGALAQGIVEYSIILANRDNAETRVFTINLEIVGNEKPESISTVSQLESACNRETITEDILYILDKDIVTTSNFNVKKCLKLDLNGHSIKSSATECFNINDNAGLTIVDRSTGGQKGSINCSNEGTANAININNGAILIADGVTIKCAKGSAITNVSGKAKISGCTVSSAIGILNQGTTTVIGGSIEDYSVSGIKNAGGTVTLNAWPTFSPGSADGVSDIWLSQGNTITIGSAITAAPTNKISVRVTDSNANDLTVDALPATITSGYATYVTDGSSNVIDPADVFTYYKSNPYIVVTLDAAPSSEAVLAEKPKEQTVYIDPTKPAGQQECTVNAYVLDGKETELGSAGQETWYVCKTPASANEGVGLTYKKMLTLKGDVRLILADGCKMTVGTAANPISGAAIDHSSGSFTVFGQTDGSGTLAAYGEIAGLHCKDINLTFNGGIVEIRSNSSGIISSDTPITINAGQVTAATFNGVGILASNQPITINGGKVAVYGTSTGIKCQDANIILGWTHPDDYIYVSSYTCERGSIITSAGKRFVAFVPEKDFTALDFDPDATTTEATNIVGDATPAAIIGNIERSTFRPLVYKEDDGQGVTTVSPGYLLSVTASGITPADRPKPDFTLGTTPYYIYKAGTTDVTIPLSVPNYGQTGAEFTVSIDGADPTVLPDAAVTGSGQTATAALPWTEAKDVEIRSARYYCTGVSYMDWDDTQKKLVPATTSTATGAVTKVYVLTGTETTALPGGWYMVTNWNTDESVNSGSDAFFTGTVYFTDDTHLILADGAEMKVNSTGDDGIYGYSGANLTIYGQSENSGTLTAAGTFRGIIVGNADFTVNGGTLSITPQAYISSGNATINGGKLLTTNGSSLVGDPGDITVNDCIECQMAIVAYNIGGSMGGHVTFRGGTFNNPDKYVVGIASTTVTGGKFYIKSIGASSSTTNISLSNGDDYIHAGSYEGTVTIPQGKYLSDGVNTYGSADADYVFGYSVNPEIADVVTGPLVMATPVAGNGQQYMAYDSSDGSLQLGDDTKALYPTGVKFTKVGEDRYTAEVILSTRPLMGIPQGRPVILTNNTEGELLNTIWLMGSNDNTGSGMTPTVIKNDYDGRTDRLTNFVATDGTQTFAALIGKATGATAATAADYLIYVLSGNSFVPVKFDGSNVPAAGQCLLVIPKINILTHKGLGTGVDSGPSSARRITLGGDGQTTGVKSMDIDSMDNGKWTMDNGDWYTIDGRKMNGRPAQKGVYIRNGQKVVIK